MEPLKLSITQITEVTGECRALIFDAIREGDLKTFIVGRRRFARPAEVKRWVDWLESESDKGRPVAYRATRSADRRAAKEAV